MRGVVRHYEWGSPTAIPALLGVEPDGTPWAELWFGDLPSAPMSVRLGDRGWVQQRAGTLPYLAKLLAADKPLSLQTHPTTEHAEAGFARENAAGIGIDAPERVYRDASAKPEIMIATSPFEALCGFRPVEQTISLLESFGATGFAGQLQRDGLRSTFEAVMRSPVDHSVLSACAGAWRPEAAWAARLGEQYPGDPAAVATLLLNYVELQPGEAIYLAAGNIHAYLRGVGIEVMGPSDNVVRCGLTAKHVDIEEMMSNVDFSPLADTRVPLIDGAFLTPGAPFAVGRRAGDATTGAQATPFESWFIQPDCMQFDLDGTVYTVSPA